jgi:glycosyltransferase involved in cell wall biosynthesis
LGLGAESEIVLFVGPLTKRKGLDCLAAAWKRVARERPHAHLVLVGPERAPHAEGGSFGEWIRAQLGRGVGADRVTFAGRVSNVEEYLRAADLFVFPSRWEGMPNVVCEAFASGLACILTPFLGLPAEFGTPGEQYILVDHDPEHLGAAISTLLANPELRGTLGRAARAWAEDHLDREQSLDQWAALCRDVAAVS